MRTRDANEIRRCIHYARHDAQFMVASGSRKMRLLVRGKLSSRAYSRTLDRLAENLWCSWIYVTCSPMNGRDFEFEYTLAEPEPACVCGGLQ